MERGQQLQSSTPNPALGPGSIGAWMERVQAWGAETQAFLGKCSSRASSAFLLVINPGAADRQVRDPDGAVFTIGGTFADVYQVLQVETR